MIVLIEEIHNLKRGTKIIKERNYKSVSKFTESVIQYQFSSERFGLYSLWKEEFEKLINGGKIEKIRYQGKPEIPYEKRILYFPNQP